MSDLPIPRRGFLAGPLILGACRKARVPYGTHLVSIVKAPSYTADLAALIWGILAEHKVKVRGLRVLLKPNLVEFSSGAPVNTHPAVVAAAAEAFRAAGASQVLIAEGPGHRRITMDVAESAGFLREIDGFESHFTDLNLDDVVRVPIPRPFSTLSELYLPKTALSCDLLVSIPKMKTHHWVGATLSMKNLFGLVPGAVYGWPKNVLHWAGIDESIADLHQLFPRQFCIVDGIDGMEGNGPILGVGKHAGVLVAGGHPPSVDAACCQVMGLDPSQIGYLQLIAKRSGWHPRAIRHAGETPWAVSVPFQPPPGFAALRKPAGDRA